MKKIEVYTNLKLVNRLPKKGNLNLIYLIKLNNQLLAFTYNTDGSYSPIEITGEYNTINSSVDGEPSGSSLILNVVEISQTDYDAGTPLGNTLYIVKE